MRVIMWSHWHPNSNGTDYWEALGIYPDLASAEKDAYDAACDRYSWASEEEQEEDGVEDEGPDFCVEEYDPDEHDGKRAGGGSFGPEFEHMEATDTALIERLREQRG